MGDPLAHVRLGIDHMVRADPRRDLSVLGGQRLDPDVFDAQLGQRHDGHQACRHVGADADDRVGKIGDAELPQRHDIGGIGLHRMGQQIGPGVHRLRRLIDAHHVMAQTRQ